jgi:acyl-CoA synthetase (AMP-forming)/AMP-acid ligase II
VRVTDFFEKGLLRSAHAPFLIDEERQLTYQEAASLVNRLARALQRRGIRPGDCVAVYSPNDLRGFLAILGLLQAEAVWLGINVRNSLRDNVRHMRMGACRAIFLHESHTEILPTLRAEFPALALIVSLGPGTLDGDVLSFDEFIEGVSDAPVPRTNLSDDAPYRISMTGGTTGDPKAVVHTHRSVEINIASFLVALRYSEPPRYLMASPMSHAGGVLAFPMLALGGTIFPTAKSDPTSLLSQIQRHRIDTTMLPPTVIRGLLSYDRLDAYDRSTLKYLVFGASPISVSKLRECLKVFGAAVTHIYGQTEASMLLTIMTGPEYIQALSDPRLIHRLSSCGREGPLTQVRIMGQEGALLPIGEVGEIVVRSGLVMAGYLDDATATATSREYGWHHTGDIGRIDDDGYVYIIDRKREMIISGGFNVYPSEVEQVIFSHPAVQECAVVGVPDEKWGEAVKAVVELKAGHTASEAEIIALCKEELGGIRAPKSVEFWDALPRSAVGKVLRRSVRSRFWEGRDRII